MDAFHSFLYRKLFEHTISSEKGAFHSDDTYVNNSKSENQFNGLGRDELLSESYGRELIHFADVDRSLEKYEVLKGLVHNANCVAAYGDQETEDAYFEHLFRRALGMDLHRTDEELHSYDDLIDHLSTVNSELDEQAVEEARLAYDLNFRGEAYETQ